MLIRIYEYFSEYGTNASFLVADESMFRFYEERDEHILILETEITPLPEPMLRMLGAKQLDKKIAEKYLEIELIENKKQQLLAIENKSSLAI